MKFLDFILIFIFIIRVLEGYYKGFFKKLFSILGFIMGIFIFKFIYPIINNWLVESWVFFKVKNYLSKQILEKDTQLSNILKYFTKINFDAILDFFTKAFFNVITLFLSILIVNLIIFMLSKKIKFLNNLPMLNKFNKIGGIIIGIINGYLTIWFLSIITLSISNLPKMAFLKSQIDSIIIQNLLNNFLTKGLFHLLSFIFSYLMYELDKLLF